MIINKIYLVLTPFFPAQDSFTGSFIFDQCKAIERNSNYKVIILKPKAIFSKKRDYEYDGLKVYYFKTLNLPSNLLPGLFNYINIKLLNLVVKSIIKEKDQLEIVHLHGIHLGFLSKAFKNNDYKQKTILQFHGLDTLGLRQGKFNNFIWQKRWIMKMAEKSFEYIDFHIGVSHKTLLNLKSFPSLKIKNEMVLYNGVDQTKFFSKRSAKKQNCYTIGCIGNFIEIKNQITLIKAVHLLLKNGHENMNLVLIGSGPTLQYCVNYVDENKLDNNIAFIKEMPHNELISFYNSLDLFVLPSYYEAFGCVYVEAHSCGVPFMAVKEQGISELIPYTEMDRYLFDKEDYEQLAKLIVLQKSTESIQTLNRDVNIDTLISEYLHSLNNSVLNISS